ncbi:hypothetical protein [Streptomyces sp. NPDC058206]|uniref:hypothetical protein n=1 Tax=Streptomyces sp. NPDC058206 TaxID=3346382 RepID=UPI0036DFA653
MTTKRDTLPLYARATGAVVLATALFMAYPGERKLAQLAGWTSHYAWAMPFVLSAYAAVTSLIAANRPKGVTGHMSARVGAVSALLLAMTAQVSAHLIGAGYMSTSAFLVAATSAVPPVVVVHVGHLLITPARTAEIAAEPLSGVPTAMVSAVPVGAPQKPAQDFDPVAVADDFWQDFESTAPDEPVTTPPDVAAIRTALTTLSVGGHTVTGRDLARHFHVSDRTGRRYLSLAG